MEKKLLEQLCQPPVVSLAAKRRTSTLDKHLTYRWKDCVLEIRGSALFIFKEPGVAAGVCMQQAVAKSVVAFCG